VAALFAVVVVHFEVPMLSLLSLEVAVAVFFLAAADTRETRGDRDHPVACVSGREEDASRSETGTTAASTAAS
jgi:hypothetical protein